MRVCYIAKQVTIPLVPVTLLTGGWWKDKGGEGEVGGGGGVNRGVTVRP